MKKFRIEVNGEEFIVNVEKIEDEVDNKTAKTSKLNSNKKSSTVIAQSNTSKSKKKVQAENAESVEIGEGDVVAPMPGNILKVNVEKGETVNKGAVLMVLEAMKMENEITANFSGTIKDINVKVGASVDAGDLLLTIE